MSQLNEQSVADRISGLEAEIADKKIKLPPDIFKYVEEHISSVNRILEGGRMPTEKDMEFMEHVRMWLSLDEVDRERFTNMESFLGFKEVQESKKRQISLSQYLACVEVLEHLGFSSEDLSKGDARIFQFPGNGRVATARSLRLSDYSGALPDNFEVMGALDLSKFQGKHLPKNLTVNHELILDDSPNLKEIPDDLTLGLNSSLQAMHCDSLERISGKISVGQGLSVGSCPKLVTIGEGLRVANAFDASNCTSLKKLPADFLVGRELCLYGCKALEEIPDNVNGPAFARYISLQNCVNLKKLPSSLETHKLNLFSCTSLKRLPDHLNVDILNLKGCDSLECLPEDMKVDQTFLHSINLSSKEQLKKDLDRVKKSGKVKGISYS